VTPITNKESLTALGARVTGPEHDFDSSNNSASFSTPVVPPTAANLLADLVSRVRNYGLPHGLENSLVKKLQAAQRNTQRGLTRPACNEREAFVNEVRALATNGVLSDAQASQLTDSARLVQAATPCS
jgi:hypothetical protein